MTSFDVTFVYRIYADGKAIGRTKPQTLTILKATRVEAFQEVMATRSLPIPVEGSWGSPQILCVVSAEGHLA